MEEVFNASLGSHDVRRKRYSEFMARGWESKSIEAQQEQALEQNAPGKPRLTREEADRIREKQSLSLALKTVVEQLRSGNHPHRQRALELAKQDLEEKLGKFNS